MFIANDDNSFAFRHDDDMVHVIPDPAAAAAAVDRCARRIQLATTTPTSDVLEIRRRADHSPATSDLLPAICRSCHLGHCVGLSLHTSDGFPSSYNMAADGATSLTACHVELVCYPSELTEFSHRSSLFHKAGLRLKSDRILFGKSAVLKIF